MVRRQFIEMGGALWQWVIAGPTQDTSPRVGIVRSDFTGSTDRDRGRASGLARPCPVTADLDDDAIDAMLRKAIEVASVRRGGLPSIVAPDDWVVIKAHNPGGTPIPGDSTDPRVVRSLIAFLAESKLGARITIAEGAPSYGKMIDDFARRYPAVRFELRDLNSDETIELPVQGRPRARGNPQGIYKVPKTIQQCDKLISVAPLKTDPRMGVSLSVGNYLGIAPGAGKLGEPDEVAVDLFSYHPADYAILGGSWGIGSDRKSVHHNVIIAGAKAVSVDATAAAVMGFDPRRIAHLRMAEQSGFGDTSLGIIWIRGNSIEEAKGPFRGETGKEGLG